MHLVQQHLQFFMHETLNAHDRRLVAIAIHALKSLRPLSNQRDHACRMVPTQWNQSGSHTCMLIKEEFFGTTETNRYAVYIATITFTLFG